MASAKAAGVTIRGINYAEGERRLKCWRSPPERGIQDSGVWVRGFRSDGHSLLDFLPEHISGK